MEKMYQFGKWVDSKPLTPADAAAICHEASTRQQAAAELPVSTALRILGRLGRYWADPQQPRRRQLRQTLSATTGFSVEMIDLGFDALAAMLCPEGLTKKLATELRQIPRAPELFHDISGKRFLSWQPLGSILHVLSGNVFLVGPSSLIEGVLTGNVTLLKLPSAETVFMPVFMESLIEIEAELSLAGALSNNIAFFNYPSHATDTMEQFKTKVQGLVVWGGEQAVQAYRQDLPASCKLVVFGPKISVGLVTKRGLAFHGSQQLARQIAFDVAIWDQNACTAPQLIYVESEEACSELLDALVPAFEQQQQYLGSGSVDGDQAAEIRKLRGLYEIAEARGAGALRVSGKGLQWTVVMTDSEPLEPSPLHRTLRLVPIREVSQLSSTLLPLKEHLQTVGIATSPDEHIEVSQQFAGIGALRISQLGDMGGGAVDDPHDGAYDLVQMMHLVNTAVPAAFGGRAIDFASDEVRERLILAKLNQTIARAAQWPVYEDKIAAALGDQPLKKLADLSRLPVGEKSELQPYIGSLLGTGDLKGGYFTRSGATSGQGTTSYFNGEDWRLMVQRGAEALVAAGLGPQDLVANCMPAGSLYGSFLSFDAVCQRIGLTQLPFASTQYEEFKEIWQRHPFNVLIGFPSTIVPWLKKIVEEIPGFRLEKIVYAGVPMSPSDIQWLRQVLKVKVVASLIGTTEAGALAYQTADCTGHLHRLLDDYCFVEVLDSTGSPLPEGEVGRIAITTLEKSSFPLVRYLIGDQGAIVRLPGCQGRFLDYRGRADDVMVIGKMNVSYHDLQSALADYPISILQMQGDYAGRRERLRLNIESHEAGELLSEQIERTVFERIDLLEQNVSSGDLEFSVCVVKPGGLPRNQRTGKVKLMLDGRFS